MRVSHLIENEMYIFTDFVENTYNEHAFYYELDE